MRRIFWAGDSTVACNKFNTFPQTGIGQAFDRYAKEDVIIYNHAVNGRSTKSFIDEKRLERIKEEISEGDYLFIQFGHNDEKKEDPSRYTEPHGSFIDNLGEFITAARNKKAYPVLISPVERRLFEDGKLKASAHIEYVKGMEEAAAKYEVPLIDLFGMSREFLQRVGDERSKQYFMNLAPMEAEWAPEGKIDNTHLKYEGAMLFAGMIAKGISDLGKPYSTLLADEALIKDSFKIEVNG
ncbi:rhamnogalacturonan acetylesterase [Butyrivibrio sp. YAB3001]|uniref:rhamnogalacturonan acetylesterase n=1 Tax=Butyrivibrio sp. YAB3001 TaxID=1520812 RepID=UPI0008F6189B|nr:rhamnogalacturonan acetylesterase [Butyrivibrio sp. YAB3001]SFC37319.1 Lysophospholipase L1 [Butyrivibrio sp. YAB3001]